MNFTPRGYALLLVLGLLAAAALVVSMTVTLGGAEKTGTILASQQDLALAAADEGLERTKAYLDALVQGGAVDLDLALDPKGDDVCSLGPPFRVTSNDGEDHLPPFADGTPTDLPGWSGGKRRYMLVPFSASPGAQGAYLVRIDDNDDDQGPGLPGAGDNTPGPTLSCVEGGSLSATQWSNPVRDRDRTVVVTVIGIAPGTDFARAHARRVLRAVVGQDVAAMAGIQAGGDVSASDASSLCGAGAGLAASGNVSLGDHQCAGCLGLCNGGAVSSRTSAATCTRSNGTCLTAADPPALVDVNPLDARWRPPPCQGGTCTPFYRLSYGATVQLQMWSWTACPSARLASLPDTCFSAGNCGASLCWIDVSANTVQGDSVYVDDSDSGLSALIPSPAPRTPATIPVPPLPPGDSDRFRVFTRDFGSSGVSCSDSTGQPIAQTLFEYNPHTPRPPFLDPVRRLPHGVWIIDGTLTFNIAGSNDMPDCGSLAGWGGAELLVRGSVGFGDRSYALTPPLGLAAALVVGGDLDLASGSNTASLTTCDSGAAIVAREQLKMDGRTTLAAPLVISDSATCFNRVAGSVAIDVRSNATIRVDYAPQLNLAPMANVAWAESAL